MSAEQFLTGAARPKHILDPGMCLTLRPMTYPDFYDRYKAAIRNTWTVDEIDFSTDVMDLRNKTDAPTRHLIERLVAFFATGDSIVSNNLVLHLYKHINAPEARMYLSRQLYEEALHVQFYLTLLDAYIPDPDQRAEAFAAIENIPSIRKKAEFCFRWMAQVENIERLETREQRRAFLKNLICFATCIEGLFFFAAFAYVYFLRSRGLFHGLAAGTNWVFRDESAHMAFAFSVVETVRREEPDLFDDQLKNEIVTMLEEAVACELQFAEDLLGATDDPQHASRVIGLGLADMRDYLGHVADLRLQSVGLPKHFHTKNPFAFLDLQDVQELANFFERRVSAYQVGVTGDVDLNASF